MSDMEAKKNLLTEANDAVLLIERSKAGVETAKEGVEAARAKIEAAKAAVEAAKAEADAAREILEKARGVEADGKIVMDDVLARGESYGMPKAALRNSAEQYVANLIALGLVEISPPSASESEEAAAVAASRPKPTRAVRGRKSDDKASAPVETVNALPPPLEPSASGDASVTDDASPDYPFSNTLNPFSVGSVNVTSIFAEAVRVEAEPEGDVADAEIQVTVEDVESLRLADQVQASEREISNSEYEVVPESDPLFATAPENVEVSAQAAVTPAPAQIHIETPAAADLVPAPSLPVAPTRPMKPRFLMPGSVPGVIRRPIGE